MSVFIIVLFSLYGLLIGSFLNVCIYRLPRGMNITTDRSHCPSCKQNLAPRDLIPVISYLLLRRRCRYCHIPISSRYAIIEVLTMTIFAFTALVMRPAGLTMALLQAVLLSITAAALIVWSMIRYDDSKPPVSLYIWIFLPATANSLIEPDRLLHLLGLLFMLICAVLLYIFRLWQLQRRRLEHEIIIMIIGGMMTAWPGTVVTGGLIALILVG